MLRKSINPCIKVASLATLILSLCISPVYAGPAVVKSDLGLQINPSLSQDLTAITNNSKLDVTVYSFNMVSDENAAKTNDNLVKTLPGTNYISIVLNKNTTGAGGTVSVNLGPDFRDYLSKEEISNNIVIPNRKKYLPDRPTEFVKSVTKDLINIINSKKQFNNNLSFVGNIILLIFIVGLNLIIILFIVKQVKNWFKRIQEEFEKAKEEKAICVDLYTSLLEKFNFSGYEGKTAIKIQSINDSLNSLITDYKLIERNPKFSEALFKPVVWAEYFNRLFWFSNKARSLINEIESLTNIMLTVKETTKDPLGVFEKIEQEKRDRDKTTSIINQVTQDYYKYKLLSTSDLHDLYKKVRVSTTKQEAEQTSNAFYSIFKTEIKNIVSLEKAKSTIKL